MIDDSTYDHIINEIEGYVILQLSKDGTILRCNKSADEIIRFKASEIIGRNFSLLFTNDDRKNRFPEAILEKAGALGKVIQERQLVRSDESIFWAKITVIAILEKRRVTGYTQILKNLTDKKDSKERDNQDEALFSRVFHMSPVAMALARKKDQVLLDANNYYAVLVGYSREELIGQRTTSLGIIGDTDRKGFMEGMRADGTVLEKEIFIKTKSGEHRTIISSSLQIRIDKEDCVLSIAFNITERKKTEEALRKSEADLKMERNWQKILIDNLPDLIFLKDRNSKFIIANQTSASFMGVKSPEALIGFTDYDFYKKESADKYYKEEQDIMNSGKSIIRKEKLQKDSNGNERWLSTIKTVLKNDNNEILGLIGIERDITESKRAVIQLREAEKRYRITLDSMIEGCQIIDFDWRYAYINRAAAKQARTNPDHLIGRTMSECFPGIENTMMFSVLRRCMDLRIADQMENHFQYADGKTGWFELHIQPSPEGLFILSLDITERKKTEEQLLTLTHEVTDLNISLEQKVAERTTQLQTANKELEAFSYSVSHDLRAPLRAINGYAKMLEEDYEKVLDQAGKRILSTIQKNASHMGSLIDDLLSFSRLGRKEIQKNKINMASVVKSVLSEFEKDNGCKAVVTVDLDDNSITYADNALIRQVWTNLIANAIKYSSKSNEPEIIIKSVRTDEEVVFSVKDNGTGFDMKYVHKLFGVFQRLHTTAEFEGTGVGLAIIKRIVYKHRGRVWAEGEKEKGATFYFSLPIMKSVLAENNEELK